MPAFWSTATLRYLYLRFACSWLFAITVIKLKCSLLHSMLWHENTQFSELMECILSNLVHICINISCIFSVHKSVVQLLQVSLSFRIDLHVRDCLFNEVKLRHAVPFVWSAVHWNSSQTRSPVPAVQHCFMQVVCNMWTSVLHRLTQNYIFLTGLYFRAQLLGTH